MKVRSKDGTAIAFDRAGEGPPVSVRALVAVLPNAKQRTLEGQDHGAAPEVLAPVLKEFFR